MADGFGKQARPKPLRLLYNVLVNHCGRIILPPCQVFKGASSNTHVLSPFMWVRSPGTLSFNQGLLWDWIEAGLEKVLLLAHVAAGSMQFLVDC